MISKYFSNGYSDRPMEKQDIIRELVYLQADLLLPAKEAVVQKPVPVIDFKYDIPKITTIHSSQVTEGSRSPRQHMEFWQKPISLNKYQTTVMVSDEAKARQMSNYQTAMTINAVATGMAQDINNEILASLIAGTGSQTTAASKWTSNAASPAQDVASIIGSIFDGTNIFVDDLARIQVYVPAKVWSYLKMPKDTGLLYLTIEGWMEQQQHVTIYPTRFLGNTQQLINGSLQDVNGALVVLPGEQTAHHLTYNGIDIPTAEQRREEGVGDEYIITRYFKTVVIPDHVQGTTTARLGWISNVC